MTLSDGDLMLVISAVTVMQDETGKKAADSQAESSTRVACAMLQKRCADLVVRLRQEQTDRENGDA